MNTRIKMTIVAVWCSFHLMAQTQPNDTISKEFTLREVTVKGQKIIPKGDHTVLLLSDKNRHFGTNALDAVSSLSLFQTKLNETELTSFDHKSVFILINGIPATALDLRAYKGEDIKNVEYYAVAPAQYMALTSGPVANIVMKKRQDKLYSAYIHANHALNTGFGTNQTSLTYADSLNQIKFNHFIDYRNIGHIGLDSYYDYGSNNHKTSYTGKDNRYKGNYQYIQMSYQRFQTKHLFNANLKYIWNPRRQNYPSEVSVLDQGNLAKGNNGNELKSHSHSLVADLYYSYSMGKRRSLAVNVVNTFSRSGSDQLLWQEMPIPYQSMNYHLENHLKNHTYSLIANAVYSSPLLGGSFNVGTRYEYLHLKQNNMNTVYRTTTHTEFLYTGIYWTFNNINLYPALGMYLSKQTTAEGSNSFTLPYIRIYTDWWGKEALQGFSVQLTMQMRARKPTSGQLTTAQTYLDRNFIAMGNPHLKQYWQSTGKLQLAYFVPDRNDQIILQYTPEYAHRPFVPVLYTSNNTVYSQPREISHVFSDELALFGSWYPVSWLEISPYVELHHSHFDTPLTSNQILILPVRREYHFLV